MKYLSIFEAVQIGSDPLPEWADAFIGEDEVMDNDWIVRHIDDKKEIIYYYRDEDFKKFFRPLPEATVQIRTAAPVQESVPSVTIQGP
jgi:hypothetical protein